MASFARAVEPGTQHQVEDGGEVAEKGDGRGLEDGAVRTPINGIDRGRGGDDRGIPAPYTAAAGRLQAMLAKDLLVVVRTISAARCPATVCLKP